MNKEDKINETIINILLDLKSFSKGTKGGHKLENLLAERLENELKGFKLVSSKMFKDYYPEYKKSLKNSDDFNFNGIELSGNLNDDNLIIEQPKGSQSSPDILIIHNKIGIPIECKTSETDKVTWNSGYPRKNYIYLFNKYKGKSTGTTFFMGQDIISNEVRNELLKQAEKNQMAAKIFNENIKNKYGKEWDLYARPMFTSKVKFFHDEVVKEKREDNVLDFIRNFKWLK